MTGGEGYGLFIVRPIPNGSRWSLEMKIRPTNTLEMQEVGDDGDGGSTTTSHDVAVFAVGAWQTFALRIDFGKQMTVTLDAVSNTYPLAATAASTSDDGAATIEIGVGEDSDKDTIAFDARLDDVACTLE